MTSEPREGGGLIAVIVVFATGFLVGLLVGVLL